MYVCIFLRLKTFWCFLYMDIKKYCIYPITLTFNLPCGRCHYINRTGLVYQGSELQASMVLKSHHNSLPQVYLAGSFDGRDPATIVLTCLYKDNTTYIHAFLCVIFYTIKSRDAMYVCIYVCTYIQTYLIYRQTVPQYSLPNLNIVVSRKLLLE